MANEELTPSQQELLRSIPDRFPPQRIDRLWLFPPHHAQSRESGFIVLSLLPSAGETAGDGKRTVVTIRYGAERVKERLRREERVTEEGSAPPERIERVIAGVRARAGAEEEEPIVEDVGGSEARWAAFLERLGLAA